MWMAEVVKLYKASRNIKDVNKLRMSCVHIVSVYNDIARYGQNGQFLRARDPLFCLNEPEQSMFSHGWCVSVIMRSWVGEHSDVANGPLGWEQTCVCRSELSMFSKNLRYHNHRSKHHLPQLFYTGLSSFSNDNGKSYANIMGTFLRKHESSVISYRNLAGVKR